MIISLFFCFYSCVLNKKESKSRTKRNEKHKYSNDEKLTLGEDENTSAIINIAQDNNSNIFLNCYKICK